MAIECFFGYERMPSVQIEDLTVRETLRRRGMQLFGCLGGVRRTLHQTDLAKPCALAIGGEKRGLPGTVRSICDDLLTIPNRAPPDHDDLSQRSSLNFCSSITNRSTTDAQSSRAG